ncbi:MAG: Uma2 family endonuclease [Hyphomicrobiaceae bacterium]
MTVDEFLRWSEALPKEAGKFELIDGEVVVRHGSVAQQQSERSQHWVAKTAMGIALHDAIRRSGLPYRMAIDGPSIRMSDHKLVQPDVLVYCGEKLPRDVFDVPNPPIVVEVLSPGTERRDHGVKFEGYFALPSLQHYLIVDPDRPAVIHHKRGVGNTIETRIVKEPALRLDPPGIEVDLSEVLAAP